MTSIPLPEQLIHFIYILDSCLDEEASHTMIQRSQDPIQGMAYSVKGIYVLLRATMNINYGIIIMVTRYMHGHNIIFFMHKSTTICTCMLT